MKFAHFADTHLGYQKQEALQDIERQTFGDSMDMCISEGVDFILMCGDLFHTNIPDMRVQKLAMEKFRQVHDAGIPVYAVYGSHDFSPTSSSAIDLLQAAGYLTKATLSSYEGDRIRLEFIKDEKTGARLAGFPGLKAGRDIEYYQNLDRQHLESADGFRIFLFHGAVTEMIQDEMSDDNLPLSYMPSDMNYYAGGHLHTFRHRNLDGYPNVVYPGTLFAGYSDDMEESARGIKRGFVLVEFGEKVESVRHVEVPGCTYSLIDVDAEDRSSKYVNAEIHDKMNSLEITGTVAILKVHGQLSSGRTTDIDFLAMRNQLFEDGARDVLIQRNSLKSGEYSIRRETGSNRDEIEKRTFQENIKQVRMRRPGLIGSRGVGLSENLLAAFRYPKPDNENKADYEKRVVTHATSLMELE